MKRIADSLNYNKLPANPAERHEQFLGRFGQDLLGFRNDALKSVYGRLEHTSWDELLPYDREFYSRAAAQLTQEQRETSRKLTERVITCFMERLMSMLSADASSQPLGLEHGVRYRLLAQVHHCPREKPTRRYAKQAKAEEFYGDDFDPVTARLNQLKTRSSSNTTSPTAASYTSRSIGTDG